MQPHQHLAQGSKLIHFIILVEVIIVNVPQLQSLDARMSSIIVSRSTENLEQAGALRVVPRLQIAKH